MSLLLQVPAVADTLAQSIVDTAAQAAQAVAAPMAQAAPAAEPVVKDLSVWNLTMAGGWLMIPLALLAVVSIYIFFERLFAVNRASKEDAAFMEKIKNFIHRGEVDQAAQLCKDTNTPYARMIEKGVSRIGRPMNDVLVAIENGKHGDSKAREGLQLARHHCCRRAHDWFLGHCDRYGAGILPAC